VEGFSEDFHGKLLLPSGFRIAGFVLAMTGVIAGYLRFGAGIKPNFLDVKVFAIYSVYFETKHFSIIGNNISEEISGVLILTGLFFFSFAREKNEDSALWIFRFKALILSVYINTVLLLISVIFIYGLGFIYILSINLFSLLIFYNLIFRYFLYRYRKALSD
jgi:hypothetical protein